MLKIFKNKTIKRFFAFLLCISFLGIGKIMPTKAYAATNPSAKILTVGSAKFIARYGDEEDWNLSNLQTGYTADTYNLTTNNAYISYTTYNAIGYFFGTNCVYVDGNYISNTDGKTYDGIKSNKVYQYSLNSSGSSPDNYITRTGFIVKNLTPGKHSIKVISNIIGTTYTYKDMIYVSVP